MYQKELQNKMDEIQARKRRPSALSEALCMAAAAMLIITIVLLLCYGRRGQDPAQDQPAPAPRIEQPAAAVRELSEWEILWMAVALTESRYNPAAVGSAHDSGILQLTPIYVKEVNRVSGSAYQLDDAFDIEKALEITYAMQDHYNPERDIELAIWLHNKSPYYRREVLKNMEFVKRMEAFREVLTK